MFLQQQGGGQDAQMAMALNLLGLGEAREQAQATSEFAREQLEALIAKQTGEQELVRDGWGLKSDELENKKSSTTG